MPKLKRSPEGRDPRFPVRVILIWLAVLIVVPLLLRLRQMQQERVEEIPYGQLEQKVDEGLVKSVTVEAGAGALDKIKGEYDAATKDGGTKSVKFATKVRYSDEIYKFLKSKGVQLDFTEASQFWIQFFWSALPFVLFVGVALFRFYPPDQDRRQGRDEFWQIARPVAQPR